MGLHLIRNDLNIDFVGLRKISYILSVVIILIGMASIVAKGGLRFGIDFAGGATVQARDLKALLPWITYAFNEAKASLGKKAA